MILGAKLNIHINYLNITTSNTPPDYAICCLNYVEQYHPYIHFISGKEN